MSDQPKLSALIREGAKLRPQARGDYVTEQGGALCTCALGAAWEASGRSLEVLQNDPSGPDCPYAFDVVALLSPSLGQYSAEMWASIIVSRNDDEGWTREQIADYVEQHGL